MKWHHNLYHTFQALFCVLDGQVLLVVKLLAVVVVAEVEVEVLVADVVLLLAYVACEAFQASVFLVCKASQAFLVLMVCLL